MSYEYTHTHTHTHTYILRKCFNKLFEGYVIMGLPGGVNGIESACQWRRCKRCEFDPYIGKIPEEGNYRPLQYSCLENPMD